MILKIVQTKSQRNCSQIIGSNRFNMREEAKIWAIRRIKTVIEIKLSQETQNLKIKTKMVIYSRKQNIFLLEAQEKDIV
jgi:hypothetical protein